MPEQRTEKLGRVKVLRLWQLHVWYYCGQTSKREETEYERRTSGPNVPCADAASFTLQITNTFATSINADR